MTKRGRRWTAPGGQLGGAELRGRDESGLPIVLLDELRTLIDGIQVPSWASGPTAAALHGFDGFRLQRPFHLITERGRNIVRVGHVIHTSNAIPLLDRESRGGIPALAPTRTLLTLASSEPLDRLTAALDSALRDHTTTEDYLHRRLGELRRSGRGGVLAMLAALEGAEITRGGHSWLEREFLRLAAVNGLPRPETQQVLGRRKDRLIRVDVRFPGTPIVVEVLGYRSHRTKLQLLADVERMNRLLLLGFQVFQFTYQQVVDEPDAVIAVVVEALTPHLTAGFSSRREADCPVQSVTRT